jgi:hypothetical protein
MKMLILFLFLTLSQWSLAISEDYHCEVRQYDVDITLTQDTTTSMWFRQNHEVLAMGYAGWVEKKGAKTTYHFYPGQFSPIEMTFKTQDTVDLPNRLTGWISVSGPFFSLWDELNCVKNP